MVWSSTITICFFSFMFDYLANNITISSGTALRFVGPYGQTLNLNGKTIQCITAGNDVTIGIQATGSLNFIVNGGGGSYIKGCRIGIDAPRDWTRIQEVLFQGIKYMAINLSGYMGKAIMNQIDTVGGVTDEAYSVGINVSGDGGIVRGNYIHNLYRQVGAAPDLVGEGVPIILNASSHGSLVELNYLENDASVGDTIGIFAGSGGGHTIRQNSIRNFCRGIESGAASQLWDNVVTLGSPVDDSLGISASMGAVFGNLIAGYPEGSAVRTVPESGNAVYPR